MGWNDKATVIIYDNQANKLNSVEVTLHTDDSTHVANGNGSNCKMHYITKSGQYSDKLQLFLNLISI